MARRRNLEELLLTPSEIAQMAGVTRQRAIRLARGRHFPQPAYDGAAGPLWWADEVKAFLKSWKRQVGRPLSAAS